MKPSAATGDRRARRRGALGAAVVLALALAVSGCSLWPFGKDKEKAQAAAKAEPSKVAVAKPVAQPTFKRVCPGVAVLRDAATVTRFRPGGSEREDVAHQAEVTDARITCTHDLSRPKPTGNTFTDFLLRGSYVPGAGTMKMEISLILRAVNGPAAPAGPANFRYFVSITDAAQNVLSKQVFETSVEFPKSLTRRIVADSPIKLEIPLTREQTGGEFGIYIGFQLTPEELAFNRSDRPLFFQ